MERTVVRSAKVAMLYKGVDIAGFCTEFSFTSVSTGSLDKISLKLQDRDGRVWQGKRWPLRGDILTPVIVVEDWKKRGDHRELACGRFELDMPEVAGPPDAIDLRGTTARQKGSSRTEKKTTGWDAVTLQAVAGDIASRNGYALGWEGADKSYERLDQKFQADLPFLERVAREAGNGIRIEDGVLKVIAYDKLEDAGVVMTLSRLQSFAKGPAVIDYRFSGQIHDRYKCCRVVWQDTHRGERYAGVYNDATVPSGETLKICHRRVNSDGEAEELAEKTLKARNSGDIEGTMTLVGNTDIRGGLTVRLTEFGGYSGKYLIQEAVHRPLGGYTTTIKIKAVK